MLKDEWKHDAVNKLAVIYWHLSSLEKSARGNIKEDLALETRDFCRDMMNSIDIFGQKYAIKLLPVQK